MTSAIINKILHSPLSLLKRTHEEAVTDLYVDSLRTLFEIQEELEEEREGIKSNEIS
jgi:glutamyl-tRNA reductase